MGKTANCIKMLIMLNTGRTIKISEFASELETNPRNIIEYRKELEMAGYTIITVPGKLGGYKLDKSCLFPTMKMTPFEKKAVIEAYQQLISRKDFLYKKELEAAMSKVMSNMRNPENSEVLLVDKYQLSMDEQEIKRRYNFIEEAIEEKMEVEIFYNSLKNGLKKHILHPYKLFLYNNSWFFLALNPEVSDVWYFKVNRIESFRFTKKKFHVWKNFDPKKYFDEFGMINNGEYYKIKLIASKVRANLMKERLYGKNQVITELSDGQIEISLEMQNKEQIISYILGCGIDVKVIEPQWLIDEICEISKNVYFQYRKKKEKKHS